MPIFRARSLAAACAVLLSLALAAPAAADPTGCTADLSLTDGRTARLKSLGKIVEGDTVDYLTATIDSGQADVQFNLIKDLEVLAVRGDGRVRIKFRVKDGRVLEGDADGSQIIWGQTDFGDWRTPLSDIRTMRLSCSDDGA